MTTKLPFFYQTIPEGLQLGRSRRSKSVRRNVRDDACSCILSLIHGYIRSMDFFLVFFMRVRR